MYDYEATVKRVIDGDTIVADIDLGFGIIYIDQTLRFYGINAPELRDKDPALREAAQQSRARVLELCPIGTTIRVKTLKDKKEKFGRYLALVYDSQNREINKLLIEEGFAVHYE